MLIFSIYKRKYYLFFFYFSESSTESEEVAALRRLLKVKKNQLQFLLSKPVFPKGFSGKYLDDNVNTDPAQNTEKAIEVMKRVIKNNSGKNQENNTIRKKR